MDDGRWTTKGVKLEPINTLAILAELGALAVEES